MGLPEWCRTHTFLEFLQLTEEHKMNEEVNPEVTQLAPDQIESPVNAERIRAEVEAAQASEQADKPSEGPVEA